MTIVAGFVNDNGVLLCSDTLVGNETAATYRPKILPVIFGDGRALIGFSGVEAFAHSTVERIRLSLNEYHGKPRSIGQIAENVRKVWLKAFREQHRGSDLSYDQIMAAIWSDIDKDVGLYCTTNSSFAQSASHVECIGAGDVLARYLIGSGAAGVHVAERLAFERGIRALGIVKAFMPGSVGGNLVAVNINKAGSVKLYGAMDVSHIETFTLELDNRSRKLCSAFASISDNDPMINELEKFLVSLGDMRKQWRKERRGVKDYAASETRDIWRAFKQADQPYPQYPTIDPIPQPPSPESPEGSGES